MAVKRKPRSKIKSKKSDFISFIKDKVVYIVVSIILATFIGWFVNVVTGLFKIPEEVKKIREEMNIIQGTLGNIDSRIDETKEKIAEINGALRGINK